MHRFPLRDNPRQPRPYYKPRKAPNVEGVQYILDCLDKITDRIRREVLYQKPSGVDPPHYQMALEGVYLSKPEVMESVFNAALELADATILAGDSSLGFSNAELKFGHVTRDDVALVLSDLNVWDMDICTSPCPASKHFDQRPLAGFRERWSGYRRVSIDEWLFSNDVTWDARTEMFHTPRGIVDPRDVEDAMRRANYAIFYTLRAALRNKRSEFSVALTYPKGWHAHMSPNWGRIRERLRRRLPRDDEPYGPAPRPKKPTR